MECVQFHVGGKRSIAARVVFRLEYELCIVTNVNFVLLLWPPCVADARLADNTGRIKVANNRHLGTIAQLCRANLCK